MLIILSLSQGLNHFENLITSSNIEMYYDSFSYFNCNQILNTTALPFTKSEIRCKHVWRSE